MLIAVLSLSGARRGVNGGVYDASEPGRFIAGVHPSLLDPSLSTVTKLQYSADTCAAEEVSRLAPDCIQPHVYFIDDSFGESAKIVRWRPFSSCCMEAQVCRRRIVYTLSFVLFSYFLRQRHQRRALCPQLLGEPKDSRIRSNVGTKCCGRGSRR
jgi:hypothetical protein